MSMSLARLAREASRRGPAGATWRASPRSAGNSTSATAAPRTPSTSTTASPTSKARSISRRPDWHGSRRARSRRASSPVLRTGPRKACSISPGCSTRPENRRRGACLCPARARSGAALRPCADAGRRDSRRAAASGRSARALSIGRPAIALYWLAQLRAALELDSLDRTDDAITRLKKRWRRRGLARTEPLIEVGDLFCAAISALAKRPPRTTPRPRGRRGAARQPR